jgi:electron transfer flavoprotein alpha/beta subunit
MNIIVCLKIVADPDIATFDVARNELADLDPVLDPIGHHVLEEGLRLRETYGGQVTAICFTDGNTAGPADAILRQALHQGADDAIRIAPDGPTDTPDTWLRACGIAKGIETLSHDLILCGTASADSGNCFMAAAVARRLSLPVATHIVSVRKTSACELIVDKKLPQGNRETYRMELPVVLGCAVGINTPRYVAPFSRVYRQGEGKVIRLLTVALDTDGAVPLTCTLNIVASKPRVKAGIDITALSMADRLKMMRGELGPQKEIFTGSPLEAARKILTQTRSA